MDFRVLLAFGAASIAGCADSVTSPPRAPTREDSTIAFVGANVVPLDTERVLASQTVLVRGGLIVKVGPSSEVAVPVRARVVDARGKYLLPGLADMHAHLVREEDLLLYAARGVTTVRNMWGAPVHLAWRERVARGTLVGPTIITAGPIVDGENPSHDGSLVVRDAAEAKAAIALHQAAGYDFVKVYSGLSLPAFEALMLAAKSAGLPVAGHVPRAVGLPRAVDDGQRTIEHLTAFSEALQTDDSPVAGKFDRASRARKLDFVDEAKLAPLVERIRQSGAWVCPTRVVMSDDESPDALRQRLARPETKYVGAFDRAIWETELERSPEQIAQGARSIALGERVIKALHEGHAKLLVGTDPANPFVIPGYSVHEELAQLVRAGMSPYEALRAATAGAAELLGDASAGTIAAGKRADLLLVEENPLADIHATERIAGVMVRGRYFGPSELASLLATVEASARGDHDPFAQAPPLVGGDGRTEFSATFAITWREIGFGAERVLVTTTSTGERIIHAQSFDPHTGQRATMHLATGADGRVRRLSLESDGPTGRGHAELTRDASGGAAKVDALLLPGVPAHLDVPVAPAALLTVHAFFASQIVLLLGMTKLEIGESYEACGAELSLGSAIDLPAKTWTITRLADARLQAAPARRYAVAEGKKPPMIVTLDARGWPIRGESDVFGAKLRFERTN
jgi:imidazolonepropionase-like amidohydrolase